MKWLIRLRVHFSERGNKWAIKSCMWPQNNMFCEERVISWGHYTYKATGILPELKRIGLVQVYMALNNIKQLSVNKGWVWCNWKHFKEEGREQNDNRYQFEHCEWLRQRRIYRTPLKFCHCQVSTIISLITFQRFRKN